jgi:hypothetical protein
MCESAPATVGLTGAQYAAQKDRAALIKGPVTTLTPVNYP